MVNHGIESVNTWWKRRAFAKLQVPVWMKELLCNSQPILLALEEKIRALTVQLQAAAGPNQPRGFGALTSGLRIGGESVATTGSAQGSTVAATPACKVA